MFDKLKGLFKGPPTRDYSGRAITHILDRNVKMAHSPDELKRLDMWQNHLTGLGILGQDKGLATVPIWTKLPYEDAASIYASDPLARKIIDHIVESALIHDYRFTITDKDEKYNMKFNQDRRDILDKKFKVGKMIKDAATWARIFGTSYILVGADDGNNPDAPLDLDNLKSIEWLRAFDAQELFPMVGAFNPADPNFLYPEYYTLATYGSTSKGNFQIHHSRVIRFEGRILQRRLFLQNGYTNDSVLNPVKELLSNYNMVIQALGIMVQEWSIGIFKIQGIESAIASGKEDLINRRISMIDKCKSVIRSVIIGKNEEYSKMSGQYQGVDNIAQFLRKELATHVDIPHTILFNEGPSSGSFGLSSGKGESEMSDWQAIVGQYQKHHLKEPISRLYRILFSAQDNKLTKGEVPKFDIKFTAARQLSMEEEAEVYSNFAVADRDYINMGVITPMEVRETRFSDTGTFKDLQTKVELDPKAVLENPMAQGNQNMGQPPQGGQNTQGGQNAQGGQNNEGEQNKQAEGEEQPEKGGNNDKDETEEKDNKNGEKEKDNEKEDKDKKKDTKIRILNGKRMPKNW